MAKTIYEMAVSYATEDGEGGKPVVIKCEKDAVIYGANRVLEEIEKLVSEYDRHPGYRYNSLYVKMKDKIRELKGE